MEKQTSWKTFALVLGAIATLITAVATLLPSLEPYVLGDGQNSDAESGGEDSQDATPVAAAENGQPAQGATESTVDPVQPLSDAQALRAAVRAATDYIVAMRKADVDQMVALADPPFFLDQGELLLTKSDIRKRIADSYEAYDPNEPIPAPDKIQARLISEAKAAGWSARNDRFAGRLGLDDKDLQVVARFGSEGIVFYYRREPDGVLLAGLWD
ncbi:MAG: hypothetical protein AAFY42_01685 [Pseudomonadota bacterium]